MSNKTMLNRAEEWLDKLHVLKSQQTTTEDMDFVQEHIDIMTYLVNCAEELEANTTIDDDLPTRPEVSE